MILISLTLTLVAGSRLSSKDSPMNSNMQFSFEYESMILIPLALILATGSRLKIHQWSRIWVFFWVRIDDFDFLDFDLGCWFSSEDSSVSSNMQSSFEYESMILIPLALILPTGSFLEQVSRSFNCCLFWKCWILQQFPYLLTALKSNLLSSCFIKL